MLRLPVVRVVFFVLGVILLVYSYSTLTATTTITRRGTSSEVSAQIAASRNRILFPGDCVDFVWRVTNATSVSLNNQHVPPSGRTKFCNIGFLVSPSLSITLPSGRQGSYSLPIEIASLQPTSWILPALALACLLLAIQPFRLVPPSQRRAARWIALACLLLALFAVFIQVSELNTRFIYLTTQQLKRHTDVLTNQADGQWQYRVLMEYVVEVVIRLFALIGVYVPTAFIAARIVQNFILFLLAFAFYRALGMPRLLACIGLCMLFWAMSHALYDSDLQYNTYADVIFYLIAALLILKRRFVWLIPLMLFASLNRETSLLIPLMLLASEVNLRAPLSISRRTFGIAVACGVIFVAVQLGLRLIFGFKAGIGPFGMSLGIEMFNYNVARELPWRYLAATLSLTPFLALYALRWTPRLLKAFFWVIVPIWIIIHYFIALVEETRLFLVPMAVVLIPVILCAVMTQLTQPAAAPIREPEPAPAIALPVDDEIIDGIITDAQSE